MTLGCERFKSVQGTKTVKSNACTIEPSFNIMDSEILGFLDFLPFSLPEPTICCCIVLRSGWKTASEIELGPFSPKLTAATA